MAEGILWFIFFCIVLNLIDRVRKLEDSNKRLGEQLARTSRNVLNLDADICHKIQDARDSISVIDEKLDNALLRFNQ